MLTLFLVFSDRLPLRINSAFKYLKRHEFVVLAIISHVVDKIWPGKSSFMFHGMVLKNHSSCRCRENLVKSFMVVIPVYFTEHPTWWHLLRK